VRGFNPAGSINNQRAIPNLGRLDMTWRGSNTWLDRLFGCLVYALPMSSAVFYGVFLLEQFPFLGYAYLPFILLRFLLSFQIIPQIITLDFVVFICLFFFVVRSSKFSHFIRFNAMQAILLGIVLSLIQILIGLLAPVFGFLQSLNSVVEVLANTIFLGMTGACGYSIIQTIRGVYAEMPVVSDAAYYQVRS
jgi:uncharacterized membrane protein